MWCIYCTRFERGQYQLGDQWSLTTTKYTYSTSWEEFSDINQCIDGQRLIPRSCENNGNYIRD